MKRTIFLVSLLVIAVLLTAAFHTTSSNLELDYQNTCRWPSPATGDVTPGCASPTQDALELGQQIYSHADKYQIKFTGYLN